MKDWYDHEVILHEHLPQGFEKAIEESSSTFVSSVKKELMAENSIVNLSHIITIAINKCNTLKSTTDQMVERVFQLQKDVGKTGCSNVSNESTVIEGIATDIQVAARASDVSPPETEKSSSSTTMSLKRGAKSRLNSDDIEMINRPAKKRLIIEESSEENEVDNDQTSLGNDETIETNESGIIESDTEEKHEAVLPPMSTRRTRGGKTPRRNVPGGMERESSNLVRNSKDYESNEVNTPSNLTSTSNDNDDIPVPPVSTQQTSNLTSRKKNINDSDDESSPKVKPFLDPKKVKEPHFLKISDDPKYMPENIGRTNFPSPFRLNKLDKSLCSTCHQSFSTGEHFCSYTNFARMCGVCTDRTPRLVDVVKLREITHARDSANISKCIVCNSSLGTANHRFGEFRICSTCVVDKKCPCHTCTRMKATPKSRITEMWQLKNTSVKQYGFLGNDFSNRHQVLLFLRKIELPSKVGEILSSFTSTTPVKDTSTPAITTNNCDLSHSDLVEFGTMKTLNSRNTDVETKYKWIPNVGKRRIFRDKVMSYASELLNNADTLNLPHCDSVQSLQENLDVALRKSNILPDGIFTFRFIQFFYDRVKGSRGNSWTSYVVDTKFGTLSFFDKDTSVAKSILSILNTKLESEWKSYFIDEEKSDDYVKIAIKPMIEFNLPMFSENEEYLWDTGLASILHSWVMTTPDTFGTDDEFDTSSHSVLNVFELLEKRTVERFRQLVLFWFLGNDMNMHLYVDMREKIVVEVDE